MYLSRYNIKPLTQRLFGKENIRQIVREWLEEEKIRDLGCKKRLTEEVIEHNIERFEQLFMKALLDFTTDKKSFHITEVCYKNILNKKEDSLTEEYITLLQKKVKRNFLGGVLDFEYERGFKLNHKFDSYLCLDTIDGLFYTGEVYKHFKFWGDKGIYGYRVNSEGRKIDNKEEFCLVPQEGNKHLIIPEEWIESFIKVGNYAKPEF